MTKHDTPPLQGVRVIDFTTGIAGPHTGLLLAHHGADVVKIEPPEGDWSRRLGVSVNGQSPFSTYYNRGKRSLALDLKHERGLRLALDLIRGADIVIESFRPGVMKRLGLDPAVLCARHPSLVFLSVSGFGQAGPLAQLPATDTVIQGYAGVMSLNRDAQGVPQRFPMILVDVVSGLYACQAAMAAYIRRLRFAQGAYIDCSLMQSALALQAPALVKHQFERGRPTVMYVPLGVLATRDGFLSISVNRDKHFVDFCAAMERPELAQDPRFRELSGRIANEASLMDLIRVEFARRTTDEWCQRLQAAEILHARIRSHDEVLADPQLLQNGAIDWLEQPGVDGALPIPNIPGGPRASDYGVLRGAPAVGEHSRQVLIELGVDDATLRDLLERGIVTAPAA
ncbi:MAG: CoA transferase [Burkholderiales bacterium]|nr:CoA transferase [Burkholderiales bacterium]